MEDFIPFEDLPIEEQLLSIISDQYKSAYGFRPSLSNYSNMTEGELREELNVLGKRVEEQMEYEEQMERENVKKFKKNLQTVIDSGAGDEMTALRWMTSEDNLLSIMDIEGYLWSNGILHTEFGMDLKSKLKKLL